MALFSGCSVLLDLKNVPFKEKKKLKSAITDHGGRLSFAVNKECTLIVTGDVSSLSTNRLRSIQRYRTPVVTVAYVHRCVDSGELLPVEPFRLEPAPPAASAPPPPPPRPLTSPGPATLSHPVSKLQTTGGEKEPQSRGNILGKLRIYNADDSNLPSYPQNFHVAKYSIFEGANSATWCVLELQSAKGEGGRGVFRVVRRQSSEGAAQVALLFPPTCEEAVEAYQALRNTSLSAGLQPRTNLPPQILHLVSLPLQELLLEESLTTGSISQEVAVFVELLWTEALGRLNLLLNFNLNKLSLNDVSRAEGLLLQAQRKLKDGDQSQIQSLMDDFYTLLPHRQVAPRWDVKIVSQNLNLCQLLRDVLNVSEISLSGPTPSSLGKYRALSCSIEQVCPNSAEFRTVVSLLRGSELQIHQVLRVGRAPELQTFQQELGNVSRLLHSSSPSNFVGILSRGLLLPRVGVEHHGIERTDVGNLGSGIYFTDDISTSLKYSRPATTDGSRLLLVCDVALGSCRAVHKKDLTLTEAPEGHHSVQGVRSTPRAPSDFEDDEFVVYSPDQVKLRYVVRFSVEGEELKEFKPEVDVSALPPPPLQVISSEEDEAEIMKNPLEEVKAGLLDHSGQQLPLQAVHVKCKLIDLLSQVVIFQKYTNTSSVPIEAKYVFPLDDSAAVCGFEAFINGKHVVGKVKEKEAARREYKQAIERSIGAYLMEQEAPDVFTVSVGNLPPGATVLIKVTFVSELIVSHGNILFSLPGSVAPWQESAALNQTTQVTVEKVCVTDETADTREFTLDMSISMPHEICALQCVTHRVKRKTTASKAVLSVLPGQVMDVAGFQLSIILSEVHLPRMWVEQHPDKDSQACMLVFYPDFDAAAARSESTEVILLLDTSESMRGRCLLEAQRVALQLLHSLQGLDTKLNVVSFGTDHTEAFLSARPLAEAHQGAESFIKNLRPVGGSTELWRPLRALSLLPPSHGVRNLLLLSDGHVQNTALTLKLLRDNVEHSRLFTCGLSPTANRHMLRALAQAGGGAYEFFDTKTKHNWAEKVARQVKRVSSPSCSSVSVKWQQFNPAAPPPVQAPKQLHALFNDCHTLVYGFVPHCTQATLHGNLNGQELATMVSTSKLMQTRGTFLHKLTARALIRDYEDGSLDMDEAEHEGKKEELKSFVVELSKEFSVLCQFTSFVAVEERDSQTPEEGFTDIPKLIAEEDVDFLPYIGWKEDAQHMESDSFAALTLDYEEEEEEDAIEMIFSSLGSMEDYEEMKPEERSESDYDMSRWDCVEKPSGQDVCAKESRSAEEVADWPARVEALITDGMDLLGSADLMALPPPFSFASFVLGSSKKSRISDQPQEDLSAIPGPLTTIPLNVHISVEKPDSHLPQPSVFSFSKSASPPTPAPPPLPTRRLKRPPSPPLIPVLSVPLISGQPQQVQGPIPGPPSAPALTHRPLMAQMKQSFMSFPRSATHPTPAPPPPPPPPPTGHHLTGPPSGPLLLGAPYGGISGSPTAPPLTHHPLTFQMGGPAFHFPQQPAMLLSPRPPPLAMHHVMDLPSGPLDLCIPLDAMPGPPNAPPQAYRFRMGTDAFHLPPPSVSSSPSFPPPPPPIVAADRLPPVCHSKSADGLGGSDGAELYSVMAGGLSASSSVASEETHSYQLSSLEPELELGSTVKRIALRGRTQSQGFPLDGQNQSYQDTSIDSGFSMMRSKVIRRHKSSPRRLPSAPSRKASFWTEYKDCGPRVFLLTELFRMQHSDGYWTLTRPLGDILHIDVDSFVGVALKNKGLCSLGVNPSADILKLLATLLVLQVLRLTESDEGKKLRSLFSLEDPPEDRPQFWEQVKKAVEWVRWADRQYPCICSRLELGLSWEAVTRQLLGLEAPPPPLSITGPVLWQAHAAPRTAAVV